MAVREGDYGGGGVWSLLAAREAGQSRERIADRQAGLQEQSLLQQSKLADQQTKLAGRQIQSQEKIAQDRLQSNERMAQAGRQQRMQIAKLSAEEKAKDRALQERLTQTQLDAQKAAREATQQFQLELAASNFKRANEMWDKQQAAYEKDRNLRVAHQASLALAQMRYMAQTEQGRRQMNQKILEAAQDARMKTKMFNQKMDDYRLGLQDNWQWHTRHPDVSSPEKATITREALRQEIDRLNNIGHENLSDDEKYKLKSLVETFQFINWTMKEKNWKPVDPRDGAQVIEMLTEVMEQSTAQPNQALDLFANQIREMHARLGIQAPLPSIPIPGAN